MSAPLTVAALRGHARRLSLPLLATSASIGVSMLVGDGACQYLQFAAARAQLLEAHMRLVDVKQQQQAQAHGAAAHTHSAHAVPAAAAPPLLPLSSLPLPDFDALLAHDRSRDGAARVPQLPAPVLDRLPRWWNATRGMSMFLTGALCGGPWQFSLARGAEWAFPGRSARAIVQKMLVNMSTAPIGISSTFYLVNWWSSSPDDPMAHQRAVGRIQRDLGSTFVTGFCYWPIVSVLNLRFVPLDYRPVVGSLAGAVWNIYISAKANSQAPAAAAQQPPLPVLAVVAAGLPPPPLPLTVSAQPVADVAPQ